VKPLDCDQLLATGALMGPYRRTHPITLSLLARFRRWLRAFNLNRRSPL
jgi:hypothetical protein